MVPGRPEQFEPRIDGDRLYGRGAYDMKGGLASMMCAFRDMAAQDGVRVRFACVADEESEEIDERALRLPGQQRLPGDFAITGEPTDLHIGIQAKGVLALRIEVTGTAAHGSTPWLGDNAVLKADRHLPPDRGAAVHARVAPTCSTGRRSTSAASWAATR